MLSYFLAFVASLVNATSNVLNRKAAKDEPAQAAFRLRLIIDLLHRRVWLAAIALMIASFALASAALGTGQLASVQLIVVLELPMTIIGGSLMFKARLGTREWIAIAAMTGGVIVTLALLDPRQGTARPVPALMWIIMSVANIGGIVVLFLAARAHTRPAARASLLGIATGLGYGLTAAYTKAMADLFNSGGFPAILSSWPLYACMTAGAASAWLLENAYQAGPLAASQPGITLVDPVISTTWGVIVFGETLNGGLRAGLTAIPGLAVAAGVVLLSRSQYLRTAQGATPAPEVRPARLRAAARPSGIPASEAVPSTDPSPPR